ncbi:hypothetical protein [Candidatus Thiosymbion oneisti]|uniref:hypothetical protein n=1 Tax=Candidatus Thiosymbion oneisti TaxID=589554 RepID=UPI000AB0ADCB|nr:hypothetical protein [Candidatus Thiosymbion oneisti]
MPEIDKIKEEIGWLKVVFGLLVAVDISLIGWTAQNFAKTSTLQLSLATFLVALITWGIIAVNRRAYRKIDELGDL